jgi:hypothetical protein
MSQGWTKDPVAGRIVVFVAYELDQNGKENRGQTGVISRKISARLKRLEAQSPKNQPRHTLRVNFVDSDREITGSRVIEFGGVAPRTYDLDRHGKEIVCR